MCLSESVPLSWWRVVRFHGCTKTKMLFAPLFSCVEAQVLKDHYSFYILCSSASPATPFPCVSFFPPPASAASLLLAFFPAAWEKQYLGKGKRREEETSQKLQFVI